MSSTLRRIFATKNELKDWESDEIRMSLMTPILVDDQPCNRYITEPDDWESFSGNRRQRFFPRHCGHLIPGGSERFQPAGGVLGVATAA